MWLATPASQHSLCPAGDVVLSVPSTACLIVDYQTGLELPQAPWHRLLKAVRRDNSTPWDILLVREA